MLHGESTGRDLVIASTMVFLLKMPSLRALLVTHTYMQP